MTAPAFGVYLHVPFCATRCGYCDFNTYTLPELGEGASMMQSFVAAAHAELELAGRVLAQGGPPAVSTVFVGGGTPTMLPPETLGDLLHVIRGLWGLAPGAEVTT